MHTGIPRREFVRLLAAGAGLTAVSACGGRAASAPAAGPPPSGTHTPGVVHVEVTTPVERKFARTHIAPGTISRLPGSGSSLAWTVDDGANADVIGAYVKFARESGARLTFFVTAAFPGWTQHRADLRPLVESGQIQLANHTWDHPDLTQLSHSAIASQLTKNRDFLKNNFGVDGTPFYRPPYGRHNAAVDRVAADLGFTVPTMWYGSLSDSGQVKPDFIVECARKYFQPQALVIGHANHLPVTRVFPQLVRLLQERKLSTVTLNDVLTTV